MAEKKSKYIIKLWNGKYGNGARFIIQEVTSGKMAEYQPTRPKDLAWVGSDIIKQDDYEDWESFEDEPIDDLNNVVF